MKRHEITFSYLKPTDSQVLTMDILREAAAEYAGALEAYIPDGPDKTYLIRKLREVAMWANVAVTRHADGSARND